MNELGAAASTATLVAIPALNEAEVVGSVIREVRGSLNESIEVVVIDDGSTDGTIAEAQRAGATVLPLPFNVGVGGAMRTAFLYAQRHGIGRVVQVDADGQHDPDFIAAMLASLNENDVVIGARFAGVGEYRVKGPRRWAMRFLSVVVGQVVGTKLTDVTSGFRAVGPRGVALFARDYPSEYLGDTVESLVLAHRAGLRVHQVGVAMRPRQGGTPSQHPIKATAYVARAALVLGLSLVRSVPATIDAIGPSETDTERRLP